MANLYHEYPTNYKKDVAEFAEYDFATSTKDGYLEQLLCRPIYIVLEKGIPLKCSITPLPKLMIPILERDDVDTLNSVIYDMATKLRRAGKIK